ncbi:MAG: dihydrodipicolinate synthase family protein [Desulfobulbaceae bacterium]|nr:dihydrodipicolinate synthase family protein [Desulfobulbaceae bacterium]MCK5543799.1 dihydrodipicolinate synthase family protein [Desulfobulbaceae bacterium]
MEFKGIFVPIITSFDDSGRLYSKGIENIISYLHQAGIRGLWLMGSYGAFPLLSEDERKAFIEVAIPHAKKLGFTVIVNVGSPDTATAVRLAEHAFSLNAHAIASVVPFYYSSTHYNERNFLDYFKKLVKATTLPLFFYNNTNTTGFVPNEDFFKKLLYLGVYGFKDKGDYPTMSNHIGILKKVRPEGAYLSGSTSVHLQGHLVGASGVTSGVALAIPNHVVNLQKALENNEFDKAVKLQETILKVRNILGRYVGRAVSCYDILEKIGVDAGTCRSPWVRMSKEESDEVVEELLRIRGE